MNRSDSVDPKRRDVLRRAMGAGIAAALPLSISAQPAPGGSIRIVIATTPGTGPDTMARMIVPELQARWKQPVIVENKPGASGVIGIEALAKSSPDGRAIMVQTSTMYLLPYFHKQLPFDVFKDFQPLTQLAWSTFALVVSSATPVMNYREFAAWVKAQPGRLNYASAGVGGEHHVLMEVLKHTAGLDVTHIPYKGAAGAQTDVMSGQVPMMMMPVQTAHALAGKEGRIRVIGVTTRARFPLFPDIPSLHEQGVTGFDFSNWYAAWAPAGLAGGLTARYNADLRDILTGEETAKAFAGQGWSVKVGTPDELARLGDAQYRQWGEVIAKTGVKPE